MAIPRSIRRARTTGATSTRSGCAPATTRASAAPRRCSSTTTASTVCAIKVARIFNTYGPRMHPADGRVVSNFIVQALNGEPITIYGDGSQTRSFCYVDDLIDGLVRLMESPPDFTGPVNLGNPEEFTIRQLADKVVALTGGAVDLVTRRCPRTIRASASRTSHWRGKSWAGNRRSCWTRDAGDHRLLPSLCGDGDAAKRSGGYRCARWRQR